MKLPPDTAIAQAKLTQYLLVFSPENDKSRFLAQAGYTQANWRQLEQDLREQVLPLEAIAFEQTRYGEKYAIRGTLTGPNGTTLRVVTIWMIEVPSQQAKFITLFPNKEV